MDRAEKWKRVILVIVILLFVIGWVLFVVHILRNENAQDLACQKLGFDESSGFNKCANETGFIYVDMTCENIFKLKCIARRELIK